MANGAEQVFNIAQNMTPEERRRLFPPDVVQRVESGLAARQPAEPEEEEQPVQQPAPQVPVAPAVQQVPQPAATTPNLGAQLRAASRKEEQALQEAQAQREAAAVDYEARVTEAETRGAEIATQQASAAETMRQRLLEAEAKRQEQLAEVQTEQEAQMSKITQLSEQMKDRKLADRVFTDPDGSRNWTASILAGIAVALGGFVQGVRGGPNPGQAIIDRKIQRDLDAQRAEWEAADKQLDAEKNIFAALRQQGVDVANEASAAKVAIMDQYDAQLQELQAATQNEERQLQFAGMRQNLAQQKAAEMAKMATTVATRKQQEIAARGQMAQAAQEAELRKQQTQVEKIKATTKRRAQKTPDAELQLEGYEQSGETTIRGAAFDRAQKVMSAGFPAKEAIKRVQEIQETSGRALSPQLRAEADVLVKSLSSAIGQLNNAGVMSEAEREFFEDMVGDPTAIFEVSNMKRLRTVQRLIQSSMDGAARAAGFIPKKEAARKAGGFELGEPVR